jgi:hypothetical protein
VCRGHYDQHLHWIEKFCLVLLGLSALLTYLDFEVNSSLMIGLSGLAVVFFLYAQRPPVAENNDGSFADLLTCAILPKVLWISCSASTIGVMFFLLFGQNPAYKNMLFIGGGTIFIACWVLTFILINNRKYLLDVQPVLMRALPILLIDIYAYAQ